MSVADNIQHTARNLTSELPFIVQILGNGMRNLSCWRSSTFDNRQLILLNLAGRFAGSHHSKLETGMRRVLDLNACRYDVYSCTHNDSESQNGSAGLVYMTIFSTTVLFHLRNEKRERMCTLFLY